jgi:chemotaxis protein CheD
MTGNGERLINVIQGDYAISDKPNEVLTTVLGSCVAVCLSDTQRGIGGINHFLLPDRASGSGGDNVRYGAYAMELLINGLLKKGADRSKLQAKIFGGANMMGNLRDIGGSNAAFARQFLKDEGIPCIAESLGGNQARRIRYWPVTGQARQLLVQGNIEAEARPAPPPKPKPVAQDITLF